MQWSQIQRIRWAQNKYPSCFLCSFPFARFQCCAQEPFPPLFACSFLDRLLPVFSKSPPFLVITSQGKGVWKAASEASPKDVPLFWSGTSVVLFWVVTLDYPRMTASREERILTKVERKQEFIRRANRAEWRGTYCVGIWWIKGILHPILAPLSGRWATSDCLLLSLLFTCSLNRHWARCCCNGGKALFLIPLLPRVHLNHLEVASLARWATVCCSSWGSKSLTGMGDSRFWFQLQLQLEPWRQVLPIGTPVLFSALWQRMLLCPQLSAKIYHGVSIHE